MNLGVLGLIVLGTLPLLVWQQWQQAKATASATATPLKHLAICACLLLLSLGICGVGMESGRHSRWLAVWSTAGLLVFGLSVLWGAISLTSFLLAWRRTKNEER